MFTHILRGLFAEDFRAVFNKLKSRGLQNCFVARVDALKDFPDAIEVKYPQT